MLHHGIALSATMTGPFTICSLVFSFDPLLLRAPSALLLQHLFLLLLEFRVNLSTLGRLVAVILCLIDARTLAGHL